MNDPAFSNRVFPFKLADWLPQRYDAYLRWLRHLLERLGPESALAVWQEVYQQADDALLLQILSLGWQAVAPAAAVDVQGVLSASLAKNFRAEISQPLKLKAVSCLSIFQAWLNDTIGQDLK